jgi:hypothetical protein
MSLGAVSSLVSTFTPVRSLSLFGKKSQMGGSRSRTAVPWGPGRMVEALDNWVGAKIAPSRDHGHFIDGSLSLDSFRVGWMPVTTALGQTATHALQQSMSSLAQI